MDTIGASTSMPFIIKSEPVDPVNLESCILELCAQNPNGLLDAQLQSATPNVNAAQRAAIINSLLAKAKIDLLKSSAGLVYKLRNPDALEWCETLAYPSAVPGHRLYIETKLHQILWRIQGANREETVVYRIIEQAGNKGIWQREIRQQSNLPQAQLNKIVRALLTKKLIKEVKTAGAARKKVYMLFELKPDESLSGGTFYTGQDFDVEFANLLSLQCHKFLQAKSQLAAERHLDDPVLSRRIQFVAAAELLEHIRQLQIVTVDLKVADIESVLNTLVWDGKAERSAGLNGKLMYRSVKPLLPPTGLVKIPCFSCPVFDDCRPGSLISPATCVYMKEWLEYLD